MNSSFFRKMGAMAFIGSMLVLGLNVEFAADQKAKIGVQLSLTNEIKIHVLEPNGVRLLYVAPQDSHTNPTTRTQFALNCRSESMLTLDPSFSNDEIVVRYTDCKESTKEKMALLPVPKSIWQFVEVLDPGYGVDQNRKLMVSFGAYNPLNILPFAAAVLAIALVIFFTG